MATCVSVVFKGAALTVLKPLVRMCRRQRTGALIPCRFAHSPRSSLYEHVREGYSDKPELDMRAVCEETDKVISNVENRKGDLQGDDVRKIVSFAFKYFVNYTFLHEDINKITILTANKNRKYVLTVKTTFDLSTCQFPHLYHR